MMLIALLLACSGADSDSDGGVAVYPMDDVLRMTAVQVIGTHNSYHQRPPYYVNDDWDYTHLPLDAQLDGGVRQLELDLHWDEEDPDFLGVWHITALDDVTTCSPLPVCLDLVRVWSDAHPDHVPVLILMEPGGEEPGEQPVEWATAVAAQVDAAFPADRRVGPDDVFTDGGIEWPTLGESRGKVAFWVDVSGAAADALGGPGSPVFLEDLTGDAKTAIGNRNNPEGDAAAIQADLELGRMVRTMADPDHDAVLANDRTIPELALATGAQAVSTNHPFESEDFEFQVVIPGGGMWRCNPVTAPEGCTAEDVEHAE